MHDRSALGPADIADAELARLVAELYGVPAALVSVLESVADEVPYSIPAITTASRHWVRGRAEVDGVARPFEFFVKHIQSWARSPYFAQIPPEFREQAEVMVPWRTEADVYRSDLADRLPAGLRMPRALGVFELDEKSAAVWLERVPAVDTRWDTARYVQAARLLGRLAASPRAAPLAGLETFSWTVRSYLEGRLGGMVLPVLASDELWQHPLVAGAFGSLRDELQEDGARAAAYTEELVALPHGTGHGDACPNNLLVVDGHDGFTLIDYGFWGRRPLGFDLGQLLVGELQLGRRPGDSLAELDDALVTAYVDGLRAEGDQTPLEVVRRAHALQLLLFSGLSSIPFELLDSPVTPEARAIAAERAKLARFSLELVAGTGRGDSPADR